MTLDQEVLDLPGFIEVSKMSINVTSSEIRSEQELTKDVGDVVWVSHANGIHEVMVQLSLNTSE